MPLRVSAREEIEMNSRMSMRKIFAAGALALVLPSISFPALAEMSRADVEAIVRDYVAKNPAEFQRLIEETLVSKPDIVTRALNEAVKRRQEAAQAANADKAAAVRSNAALLFDSTRQVTLGNPKGNVTLVEFFDYNCGFCKRAMNDKIALIERDPNLKVVLKELPVLGAPSVEAARVAIAVRMQDETGKKYLEFHRNLLAQRRADRETALAVARDLMMDMPRIERDLGSDEVRLSLEETSRLARALGISGTPSYVVGERVVAGAVGLDALSNHIQSARQN